MGAIVQKGLPRCFLRIVLSMALFALAACKVELHSNLQETEANEMMARLSVEGIRITKIVEKDTVTLMVEEDQFGQAVNLLGMYGLPRHNFSTMGEVFNSEGLVASPLQEWARFNFAKSQELSESISSIPGVIKANVHIAETRDDSPFTDPKPPSASVLIQMHEHRITDDLVPQIKQLVSFAIPDIEYDRVGVIVSPIQISSNSEDLVTFWGLIMHPKSAEQLRSIALLIAIGAIGVLTLCAGGVVLLMRNQRKSSEVA